MGDEIPIEDLSDGISINKLKRIIDIIKNEYIFIKGKSLFLKKLIIFLLNFVI